MKKHYYYIICMALAAAIAALGNLPYGYRFASTLLLGIKPYSMIIGVIFAATAALANAALGTYSLLNMYENNNKGFQKKALIVSLVGAIPMGFICFFGYKNLIPIHLNLLTSGMVSLVNGAIGYVAITGLLHKTKQVKRWFNNFQSLLNKLPEVIVKTVGFLLGLGMSLVGYIASANGMEMLFQYYGWSGDLATKVVYVIAILTWIPFAALYANSTQEVFGEMYQQAINVKKNLQRRKSHLSFSLSQAGLIIFSLLSGTALTQIAVELFSPDNNIPEIFKQDDVQLMIDYFLIPITFISVSAVNYLALKKLMGNIIKNDFLRR